jgi:hypothetical protein
MLPRWIQILEDLIKEAGLSDPLTIRMMPRDVVTRWNSTYKMLIFTLEYRKAIDEISVDRDMRKYELSDDEWGLVQELCDVLGVCHALSTISASHNYPDIPRRNTFLFTFYTKPCNRDTRNGSH